MTTLTVAGQLLTASADDRTLTYKLLPFEEEGRTNLGRVIASKGSVTVPADLDVRLNIQHDRNRPVGKAVAIEETDEGLLATFSVAKTRAGDDLLEEAREGLRPGASVELDGPVIRAGRLVSAVLTGVGAVVDPAFPSALLVAEDAGDLPEADADPQAEDTDENTETADGTEPPADTEREADVADDNKVAASAPADLVASKNTNAPAKEQGLDSTVRLLAQAYNQQSPQLLAALADVTVGAATTGIFGKVNQATWLGELWSGRAYERKFVPLANHGTVTGMKVQGWRFVDKPVMTDYTGNKTAITGNTVSVESVEAATARLAGGWDIDRAYFDLGSEEFIASFLRALTESYAKLSDGKAFAALQAAAVANPTTPGAVPSGVGAGMAAIVDGALAILDKALPSYAIVAPDLYRDVLLTRSDDTLAYLNAALGLEDGTVGSFRVLPGASLEAGQVIVGAKDAVTFFELGETPIRVEAEHIANGGKDIGVFGYYASIVNEPKAITLVDTAPGV